VIVFTSEALPIRRKPEPGWIMTTFEPRLEKAKKNGVYTRPFGDV
jgi:hypothetical protein